MAPVAASPGGVLPWLAGTELYTLWLDAGDCSGKALELQHGALVESLGKACRRPVRPCGQRACSTGPLNRAPHGNQPPLNDHLISWHHDGLVVFVRGLQPHRAALEVKMLQRCARTGNKR